MATTLASVKSSRCSSEEDKTIQSSVKETKGAAKKLPIDAGKCSLERHTLSLLERLKAPIATDIARKCKIKTSYPSIGKCQCKVNHATDPKHIEPSKRVEEFFKQ